jgi:hypothetical protein
VLVLGGDIYRPSDKRLKQNFKPLDPQEHANNLSKLRLYEYDIGSGDGKSLRTERGVIAQEAKEAIPHAVKVAGDVTVGEQKFDDLLVVNERALLYENIGATIFANEKLKVIEEEQKAHAQKLSQPRKLWQKIWGAISPHTKGMALFGWVPGWLFVCVGVFWFSPFLACNVFFIFSHSWGNRVASLLCILILVLQFGFWPVLGGDDPNSNAIKNPPPCMFSNNAKGWGPLCSTVPYAIFGGFIVLLVEVFVFLRKRQQKKDKAKEKKRVKKAAKKAKKYKNRHHGVSVIQIHESHTKHDESDDDGDSDSDEKGLLEGYNDTTIVRLEKIV